MQLSLFNHRYFVFCHRLKIQSVSKVVCSLRLFLLHFYSLARNPLVRLAEAIHPDNTTLLVSQHNREPLEYGTICLSPKTVPTNPRVCLGNVPSLCAHVLMTH